MAGIDSLVLECDDVAAAEAFYAALALPAPLTVTPSGAPSSGFRGYTLSVVVPRPSVVDVFLDAALEAGATALKPARKSFWGYGGVVQTPDGAVWKVATSSKKTDDAPAGREVDDLVLLLGVEDVKATRQFYVDHGFTVAKSFGSRYVEFASGSSPVKLALYGRRALAKDAGVPPDGSGSHRLLIGSGAGPFTDPDGFAWTSASDRATTASSAAQTEQRR